MRVGKISDCSFKKIKMDQESYWNLRCRSSKEEIDKLKQMSLKGFDQCYITYDSDWGRYGNCLLKGTNSNSLEKICIPLGDKPSAQNVRNTIRNYNRYA